MGPILTRQFYDLLKSTFYRFVKKKQPSPPLPSDRSFFLRFLYVKIANEGMIGEYCINKCFEVGRISDVHTLFCLSLITPRNGVFMSICSVSTNAQKVQCPYISSKFTASCTFLIHSQRVVLFFLDL